MRPRTKKRYIVWGSLLLLVIVIRLLLPAIVLYYANRTLAGMEGYYGHVNGIDIDLYRGAYRLDSLYINKLDSKSGKQTSFLTVKTVDLSIEWKSLFDGALVGELEFYTPKLVFTKDKTEIGQIAKDTNDFRKVLKKFMPLKVNRFLVTNGSIHYVDHTTAPKVDISLQRAYILAQNLKNTTDSKTKLPSTVIAKAQAYSGTLNMDMKLDALADKPTFDLSAEIKGANLVAINDFFKAYGKFDVSKGTFGLYSEFAAADNKFKGYVKPLIKDLQVKGLEDRKDNFFQKAKETIIDAAASVFKNQKKDQVATKIPIEGTFSNASVDTWTAIWEILKNAFIEALMPNIDYEIDLNSVEEVQQPEKKGFFKVFSVFKKDEKKEQQTGLKKYSTSDKSKEKNDNK